MDKMQNLSVSETAKSLGISRAMLYKIWKKKQGPPFIKIGRRTLIPLSSLKLWLNSNKENAK